MHTYITVAEVRVGEQAYIAYIAYIACIACIAHLTADHGVFVCCAVCVALDSGEDSHRADLLIDFNFAA